MQFCHAFIMIIKKVLECWYVQVVQTSALTDSEQEDIRIMELENTVQRVQLSIYSINDYVLMVPDVSKHAEGFLLCVMCTEVILSM